MSTSNIPLKQSHTVTVSGVVETSAVLPPSDARNYCYRACTVAITCNGWNDDNKKEYDGNFTAYCASVEAPNENECFSMKSRFIPSKESATFNMYYEADHKIFVGTSETFTGVLHNNTALSGLGIVSSRRTIPDEDNTKSILCFVMKHVDYQPQLRKNQYFEIEYRIRPTRNMEKSQNLVQLGRETLINGFIVDWDGENSRWIVEVTGVSPCTGNEGVSGKKTDPAGHVTPAGRVKPAKHVSTPSTPNNAAAGPSSTPLSGCTSGSTKRKAENDEEVPLQSPVAGRRDRPAKHVVKALAPTPAKLSRAQGKGKAKASSVVLESDEIEPADSASLDIGSPLTPAPKQPRKQPAKKTTTAKAKKAKALPKQAPVQEELIDDEEVLAEDASDDSAEE